MKVLIYSLSSYNIEKQNKCLLKEILKKIKKTNILSLL